MGHVAGALWRVTAPPTWQTCEIGTGAVSAPLLIHRGIFELAAAASSPSDTNRPDSFALTGRSAKLDPLSLPVRGDLAHVRLAGTVFVPHYAVPMPHKAAAGGAVLRKAAKADAEVLRQLPQGTVFDVLDMAGNWAWGEFTATDGTSNTVGYILLTELETAA